MHTYDYAEFLRNKRKESRKFVPTERQLETAMGRVKGTFRKYHGWISAMNEKELVQLLAKEVFNRNRELGDYKKGEFLVTLAIAVRRLDERGVIVFDDESSAFGLVERVPDVRRHRQKYPRQRRVA